jgi:hypothetical protein
MASDKTGDAPVVSFAICLDCGADIDAWRERLLPIRTGSLRLGARMRGHRRRQHEHWGSQRPSECMTAMRKVTIESASLRGGHGFR